MSNTKSGDASRRNPDREQQWRDLFAQYERSGQSVREFCKTHKIQESSFYYWRREIRLRDRETNGQQPAKPKLAPVVVIDESPSQQASANPAQIEIILSDITVRVPQGVTQEQLGMVLAALEQSRC